MSSSPVQVILHTALSLNANSKTNLVKTRSVLRPLRGFKKKATKQPNKEFNEQNKEMSQNLPGTTTLHLQDSS